MNRYDHSDCLAMSEDASWFAFPGEFSRAEAISALGDGDGSWFDTLRLFHVKRGYVVQGVQDGEAWYWEAEAGDADAIACWIAKRR